MIKYIAYCSEKGVYLGEMLGLGFWSNLDSVGQDSATVFPDEQSAHAYFASAETEITYSLIPVEVLPGDRWITAGELQRQGKPYWVPDAPLAETS